MRVLLIDPEHHTEPRIPLAMSILSVVLRNAGHDAKVISTVFWFKDTNTGNRLKKEHGFVLESDIDKYLISDNKDVEIEIKAMVRDYQPNLIAMTMVENKFTLGIQILEYIKEVSDVPNVVGGIMPTIAPEMVLEQDPVDMICIGEGEGVLVELANSISQNKDYSGVRNLWIKDRRTGKFIKNPIRDLIDMDSIPFQDWSDFDDRYLYKAFCGSVYRVGSFEISRGCMKRCGFCVAPMLRKVYTKKGYYIRHKSPRRVVDEILSLKDRYRLEMLHFCDTDFLVSMKFPYLQELSCLYKKEVGLPFMMQAGAETINEGNIKLLKEMNCITMSIGVETGSESLRRKVLHKNISNERIKYAFRLAKEYGIRTTANYMIGLPFETEEDVMESIRFNKELLPPSIAVTYFIPFVGTEFYNLCIEKGYYKKFDPDADTYRESPLETEYLSNRRINELLDIFVQEYNKEIKKRPLPTSLIRPKI